jgi:hypothetical protein
MAIQQTVVIDLFLQGDGASTVFTYSFNKLFSLLLDSGGVVMNPSALPSSATTLGVPGTFPSCVSTIDGFGNLVLTFGSAIGNGVSGEVTVQLNFASGTLSGTTAAWTSATALNTTWTLPLAGSAAVLVPFVVTGTVTAGTIIFQASADGATWFPIQGTLPTGFQTTSSWTPAIGNNAVLFNTTGYSYLRLSLSVVIAGSGTVTFIMQGTAATAIAQVAAGLYGTYNTAAPATASGAAVALQTDSFGNLFVNPIRRSQVVPATGNIASTTPATMLAAQGAGIFADLSSIVLTVRQGATANIFFGILISDGTNTYRFNFMSQSATTITPSAPVNVNFDPPIPAKTANTAWTIALSAATDTPSVDYVAMFVQQKAE